MHYYAPVKDAIHQVGSSKSRLNRVVKDIFCATDRFARAVCSTSIKTCVQCLYLQGSSARTCSLEKALFPCLVVFLNVQNNRSECHKPEASNNTNSRRTNTEVLLHHTARGLRRIKPQASLHSLSYVAIIVIDLHQVIQSSLRASTCGGQNVSWGRERGKKFASSPSPGMQRLWM